MQLTSAFGYLFAKTSSNKTYRRKK